MKKLIFLFLMAALSLSAAELTLTWQDNSDNEEGFMIERSTDGVNFLPIWQVAPDVESYVDGDLLGDTEYFYRVRAFNAAGNSAYTNIASAITSTEILPDGPTLLELQFPGQLTNISSRGLVDLGSGLVIGGFTISGGPATVLIRAIGPTIGNPPYSVPNALADPRLELFQGQTSLLVNDDWSGQMVVDASIQVGAFPLPAGSKDSAMLLTLPPGNYTVHLTGVGGGTGVALLEIYHVESP